MTPFLLAIFLQAAPQVVLGETRLAFTHDGLDTVGYQLCVASTGECRDQPVTTEVGDKVFVSPKWLPRGEQILTVVAQGLGGINSAPSEVRSFRLFVKPGRPGPLQILPGEN